jgi:hypothetical protein
MSPMAEASKLAELRRKTDRQLSRIIGDSLDSGFTFARVAEAHCSLGDPVPGERLYERARQAAKQCEALLPVACLDADERQRLEQKLQRLRDKLDALAGRYGALRHSACC